MSLKIKLKDNKKLIFTLELAGLLHDTGKLSSEFIKYRKVWQKIKCGCDNDPHEKNFFDNDPLMKNPALKPLSDTLNRKISTYVRTSVSNDISLKEIMHEHIKPKHELSNYLKLADSVDSAYDRNNPLMVMEQFEDKTYISNVFGHETEARINDFDNQRKLLFCELQDLLPSYLNSYGFDPLGREYIFNAVEKAFKNALTDTCRPANDITLWQHSYVTAALTKVFYVHYLIYNEDLPRLILKENNLNFEDAQFSLVGFGWDGLSFISRGHKIGDIVLKKDKIIKQIKNEIKLLVEYKYPIGMNVYDDDNGIYFIVPEIKDDNEYKKLLEEIEAEVEKIADGNAGGEIQPVFSDQVKSTHFIMEIVRARNDVLKESAYPMKRKPSWISKWNSSGKTICPVCQKRPVINERQNICDICKKRRISARKCGDVRESVFANEIADDNGRLALIVAKFSLEPWLCGDMIWSLFVKEANSLNKAIEHLGEIKDFEASDNERKKSIGIVNYTDYSLIKEHIDKSKINNDFGKAISFLYDRHLKGDLNHAGYTEREKFIADMNKYLEIGKRFGKPPDLYNFLLSKNHTPSRILHVWNTTRDFLEDGLRDNFYENTPSFRRIKLQVEWDVYKSLPDENAVYDAEIEGEPLEIFREDNKIFAINKGYAEADLDVVKEKWLDKQIKIISSEYERGIYGAVGTITSVLQDETAIYPCRFITSTPDILMALVPADKALTISNLIYEKYREHFGKVIGRLPLSIGNIFFNKEMPMFVVLDAGRKMLGNFGNLYEKYWETGQDWEIAEVRYINGKGLLRFKNNIEWQIDCTQGAGENDYFHPYMIVTKSERNGHRNNKSFIESFLGDLVYISELEKGYTIKVYPNYFDFEFLDSNARRFDITLGADKKRKSSVACFKSKPFLLDELNQKIMYIWNVLIKGKVLLGITDTKLRNLQSLWLTKYQEWRVDISDKSKENYKRWEDIVLSSIQKEFKKLDDDQCSLLIETIKNGLFFDTLELYLGILKERIETK